MLQTSPSTPVKWLPDVSARASRCWRTRCGACLATTSYLLTTGARRVHPWFKRASMASFARSPAPRA
eukprot:4787466-Prymnesium_polylepis.1